MKSDFFSEQVLPLKDEMYRFALRSTGDTGKAKDVVQDSLIKLWKKGNGLRELNSLKAYVITVVRNTVLDQHRKKSNHFDPIDERHSERESTTMDPFDYTETNDLSKQLSKAMKGLPESQRMTMHLRDIEGYSYKEICDALQLSMAQVKSNLFRSRNYVKEQMLKVHEYGL